MLNAWRQLRSDWRFTCGVFFVAVFLQTAAFGQLTAFTPLYLREIIQVDRNDVPFWTGILAATSLVLAVPLAPWWGVLADRYSRKLFIVRSMVADAIGYTIAASATELWHVIALRMVLGFSFGSVGIVFATQTLITPERRVGMAIGIIQAALPLGSSIGPLLGGAIVERVGLRGLFAINAAVVGLAFLLILIGLQEPDVKRFTTSVPEQLRVVSRAVLHTPAIKWNFVLWFLVAFGTASVDPYVPLLIERVYDGPNLALTIGLTVALYGLVTGIATPLIARLGDNVGPARWIALSMPWLAVSVVGLAFAPSLPFLLAGQLMRALPQSGTQAVLYTHLAQFVPRALRASVMGLSPLPRNVAMLIAPLAAAAASSISLTAVFLIGALAYVAAFAASFPLRRASQDAGHTHPGFADHAD